MGVIKRLTISILSFLRHLLLVMLFFVGVIGILAIIGFIVGYALWSTVGLVEMANHGEEVRWITKVIINGLYAFLLSMFALAGGVVIYDSIGKIYKFFYWVWTGENKRF